METIVDGVRITLTDHQIAAIQKVKKQRERCRNSFKKMLIHFGFKQVEDQPISFEHKANNWYAEIINLTNYDVVWMTGKGLKAITTIPGGWIYESPREIQEEIEKAVTPKE